LHRPTPRAKTSKRSSAEAPRCLWHRGAMRVWGCACCHQKRRRRRLRLPMFACTAFNSPPPPPNIYTRIPTSPSKLTPVSPHAPFCVFCLLEPPIVYTSCELFVRDVTRSLQHDFTGNFEVGPRSTNERLPRLPWMISFLNIL
jgi:hypothetical protein